MPPEAGQENGLVGLPQKRSPLGPGNWILWGGAGEGSADPQQQGTVLTLEQAGQRRNSDDVDSKCHKAKHIFKEPGDLLHRNPEETTRIRHNCKYVALSLELSPGTIHTSTLTCKCTFVHMLMHTHVHTPKLSHVHSHTHSYALTCTWICKHTHTHNHVHAHAHAYKCTHTYVCALLHTHSQHAFIHVFTCILICLHTQCLHIYTCIHTHAFTHALVCIHT